MENVCVGVTTIKLDNVFKVLHRASKARRCLPFKDRQPNLEDFLGPFSSTNRGLIFKILSVVFEKIDIPGLEYHSSTVGRLFKSDIVRSKRF